MKQSYGWQFNICGRGVTMKKDKDFSTQLMAFTFFYAIGIYLLFLGFHYWDKHIDYKSEK